MKILIIGKGSVGSALIQFHKEDEIFFIDKKKNMETDEKQFDIINICIPLVNKEDWIGTVNDYIFRFGKASYVIHSTVVPGVIDKLDDRYMTVYSPIRATESIMPKHLARTRKFFAFISPVGTPAEITKFVNYFYSRYPSPLLFNSAKSLVYGKLLEVADFGIQIAVAQMVKRDCDRSNLDFEEAYNIYRKYSQYGKDYNDLENNAPKEWVQRAIFRPGKIGGKCVMQDIKLLETYGWGDSDLWNWVNRSNGQ